MDPKAIPVKKGSTGYGGCKLVNGNRLGAQVDLNGFPLACKASPANVHDTWPYGPTLEGLEISGVEARPSLIFADAAYDAQRTRQYNQKRGMKSNIPVNRRAQRHPK